MKTLCLITLAVASFQAQAAADCTCETLHPQTAAESSAGVTPTDFCFATGDVRRYGAVLDGSADDTDALEKWFSVGGKLYGHPGTARVTEELNGITSDTIIDGRGMKIVHDTPNEGSVIELDQVENVTITNLEIDGRKSRKTASGVVENPGIRCLGCKKVRLVNNYVHDCYEHGIRFGSITNADTTVETRGILITRNYVRDNGNTKNRRGAGIWLFGLVRGALVTDNFVTGNMIGISIDDTSISGTPGRDSYFAVFDGNVVVAGPNTSQMRTESAEVALAT